MWVFPESECQPTTTGKVLGELALLTACLADRATTDNENDNEDYIRRGIEDLEGFYKVLLHDHGDQFFTRDAMWNALRLGHRALALLKAGDDDRLRTLLPDLIAALDQLGLLGVYRDLDDGKLRGV